MTQKLFFLCAGLLIGSALSAQDTAQDSALLLMEGICYFDLKKAQTVLTPELAEDVEKDYGKFQPEDLANRREAAKNAKITQIFVRTLGESGVALYEILFPEREYTKHAGFTLKKINGKWKVNSKLMGRQQAMEKFQELYRNEPLPQDAPNPEETAQKVIQGLAALDMKSLRDVVEPFDRKKLQEINEGLSAEQKETIRKRNKTLKTVLNGKKSQGCIAELNYSVSREENGKPVNDDDHTVKLLYSNGKWSALIE